MMKRPSIILISLTTGREESEIANLQIFKLKKIKNISLIEFLKTLTENIVIKAIKKKSDQVW